jgi:hypothetical protein
MKFFLHKLAVDGVYVKQKSEEYDITNVNEYTMGTISHVPMTVEHAGDHSFTLIYTSCSHKHLDTALKVLFGNYDIYMNEDYIKMCAFLANKFNKDFITPNTLRPQKWCCVIGNNLNTDKDFFNTILFFEFKGTQVLLFQ